MTRGSDLRAELVVVAVADVADVAQHEVDFVGMALRERADVLHAQAVALLAETRQQQAVERQVGDLAQHGHAALFGETEEIGMDLQPSVADEDIDQDRAVGDVELRAVGIAVLGPESGIEVVEQQVERLEVFAFVVAFEALLPGLHADLALRGADRGSDVCVCGFHGFGTLCGFISLR